MDPVTPPAADNPPPREPTPLRPAPPPPPADSFAPSADPFALRVKPPAPPPPPRPGRGCLFYFLLVFFIGTMTLGMLLLALPVLAILMIGPETAGELASGLAKSGGTQREMREIFVPGADDAHCPRKVAIIQIQGIILPERGRGFAQSQRLVAELEQAAHDDDVVAVILDMDTPGGSVTASDEIYQAVVYCAEYKPVVTCMRALGASGGYYVAAKSD